MGRMSHTYSITSTKAKSNAGFEKVVPNQHVDNTSLERRRESLFGVFGSSFYDPVEELDALTCLRARCESPVDMRTLKLYFSKSKC